MTAQRAAGSSDAAGWAEKTCRELQALELHLKTQAMFYEEAVGEGPLGSGIGVPFQSSARGRSLDIFRSPAKGILQEETQPDSILPANVACEFPPGSTHVALVRWLGVSATLVAAVLCSTLLALQLHLGLDSRSFALGSIWTSAWEGMRSWIIMAPLDWSALFGGAGSCFN